MYIKRAILFFLLSFVILAIGVSVSSWLKHDATLEALVSQITLNLEGEIKSVEAESERLISSDDERVWEGARHSFFLLDSGRVVKWNQNRFLPDVRLLEDEFELRLFSFTSRGSFLVKKWKTGNERFIVSIIPLYERYFVNNQYLSPVWNRKIFPVENLTILNAGSVGYPIRWRTETLFTVNISDAVMERFSSQDSLILFFASVSVVLFLIGGFYLSAVFHKRGRYALTFFVLLACLLVLRLIMMELGFPRSYSSLFIFDPLQFASSSLNPSIADLFFNALCVLVLAGYFFNTYHRWSWIKRINKLNIAMRLTVAALLLVACFYAILFSFLFLETIYHNSSISLDITQTIHFDLLRSIAFLSILLGSLSSFLFLHAFFRIALSLTGNSKLFFVVAISVAAIIFYASYIASEKDYSITLFVGLCYLIVLYVSGLASHLARISNSTFVYLFFAIVVFSLQGAFSDRRFVEEKSLEGQFRFGSNFLVNRDIFGEYLLHQAAQRIAKDQFIQSRMVTPFLSKSGIRQKIDQLYINSYFDRYDVNVFLYNASGEPIDNTKAEDFATRIKAFQKEANKTGYEGLYFIESKDGSLAKRYLAIIPIKQTVNAGFVVLDLTLKRLIPQNVFPELLVDNQFTNYFKNTDFSYAIFFDGQSITTSGDYNYEKDFDRKLLSNPILYTKGIVAGGDRHLGILGDEGRVAIVSASVYSSFRVLANFAFLLVLGLVLVLLFVVVYAIVIWRRRAQLNYSAKIQAYVYMAFMLPLIAVSATTLNLISRSTEDDLKKEYLSKSRILGDRLSTLLHEYVKDSTILRSEFESQLLNLTKLANLDASVFAKDGTLIASSQPLIYQYQLVSNLIDRQAWTRIVKGNEASFVKNDAIGKLNFNTSYSYLKSQTTGELVGIVSIPFFDSAHSLEKTQINVWSNIIVVFVVVLMIFSVVSFFMVNWLTMPLRFIANTLGRTTFSTRNQPLKWESKDEIGLLVKEYNRMLENLEISRVEVARSQKESAWREIAKQIAHEINNPLTPMKLTLQRMEMAQQRGTLDRETTEQAIQTLLSQVEILNQIASSFSAFAKMPAPVLSKVNVHEVLKTVSNLYASEKSAAIRLNEDRQIVVLGDQQLLARVFSNIVLNAIQSVEDGRLVNIDISVRREGDFCVVSITDDGSGIDRSLAEKIFLPHFSTKKSGSGIGLAIAKQGIELSGGQIWFESIVGKGTSFHMKLPLYNSTQ